MEAVNWLGDKLLEIIIAIVSVIINLVLQACLVIIDIIMNAFRSLVRPETFKTVIECIKVGDLNILEFLISAFVPMGVAIAVLIFFVSIYQTSLSPLLTGGQKIGSPLSVVGRLFLAIVGVWLSGNFINVMLNIFQGFYNAMDGLKATALGPTGGSQYSPDVFTLTGTFSEVKGLFESAPNTNIQDNVSGLTTFPIRVLGEITSLAYIIIAAFLLILIGWNLLQFYLELFERYAVFIAISSIAPLAISTSVSPSTSKIAKKWLSFFFGQGTLWICQVLGLLLVQLCLASEPIFIGAFDDVTQGILVWAGMSYGFINIARHMDDYINKLGLIAATTGEGLFKDLASLQMAGKSVERSVQTPGNIARGARDFGEKAGDKLLGAVQTGVRVGGNAVGRGSESAFQARQNGSGSFGSAAAAVRGAGASVGSQTVQKIKSSAPMQTVTSTYKTVADAAKTGIQEGKQAHDTSAAKDRFEKGKVPEDKSKLPMEMKGATNSQAEMTKAERKKNENDREVSALQAHEGATVFHDYKAGTVSTSYVGKNDKGQVENVEKKTANVSYDANGNATYSNNHVDEKFHIDDAEVSTDTARFTTADGTFEAKSHDSFDGRIETDVYKLDNKGNRSEEPVCHTTMSSEVKLDKPNENGSTSRKADMKDVSYDAYNKMQEVKKPVQSKGNDYSDKSTPRKGVQSERKPAERKPAERKPAERKPEQRVKRNSSE